MSNIIHKQPGRVVEAVFDGEVFLMDVDSGHFFTLRESAARIWELIDGSRNRDNILAQLREEFGGPNDVIARDLDAFLTKLQQAAFVA